MAVRFSMMARMVSVAVVAVAMTSARISSADDVKPESPPVEKASDAADGDEKSAPKIQVAILLDTSSSMSGLIGQARSQLWKVVNEYALARRDGKAPTVEVAVYEYGNSRLARKDGFVRKVVELTEDLDEVSEALFKLTTSGGSEHCGQVIERSVADLKWDDDTETLKCIFIAGNEAFTQGPVDYRKACQAAIEKGITVNTIHCGTHNVGVSGKWQEGALLADGSFMSIDHNQRVVEVPAPQDKELVRLSSELNTTYIAFGSHEKRASSLARQSAQDGNAANYSSGSAASRANFKSLGNYNCASWDLVDALNQGKVKLADIKKEQLPESLRKMTTEELKAHVAKNTAERKRLQEKVKVLNKERQDFLAKERKKLKGDKANSLDVAMIGAVRKQAEKKNYVFEK